MKLTDKYLTEKIGLATAKDLDNLLDLLAKAKMESAKLSTVTKKGGIDKKDRNKIQDYIASAIEIVRKLNK